MDEFLQLKWCIKEPHELDYGSEFIPQDEISLSYIYSGNLKIESTKVDDENDNTASNKQQLVPGQLFNFNSRIKSFLNKVEQSKCLVALNLLQAHKKPTGFYEQSCMELYNNSLQEILQENAKFLKFAKEQFQKSKNRPFKFKPALYKYSETLWKRKLNRCKEYRQFYKGIDMLPYSYNDDEEPVEMIHTQNILELGTLARFSGPTLLKAYHLKKKYIPTAKIAYNSKQTVSKDGNIDKLIEATKVDVVISSSGLTKLLNFTKTNTIWDIPIIVKQFTVPNEQGTTDIKNVVFIDKPFTNRSPSIFEFNEKCMRLFLKTNFCDTEAFSFQNIETPIDTYGQIESDQAHGQIGSDTENKQKENSVEFEQISSCCGKRKLRSNATQENCKKMKLNPMQSQTENIKIHHNVSYRLWKLQLKNEQCGLIKGRHRPKSLNILIRCKLDGCESTENGQLQPINVVPKVEYHLEYGAGIPSQEELLKEWVLAFFRPYSQVRRIRVHYNTGEVVSVENCNLQKIAFECQTNYKHNFHLGLGVLYKIFNSLVTLTPGNYLLHHLTKDGPFVALLKETTENEDGIYNLYAEYDVDKCKINPNRLRTWHPIDVNFVLPRHNLAQEMPGMFKPRLITFDRTKKRGKKKKKQKAKRKKAPSVKFTD